ncbi:MAG TPA: TIGR00153 family protein [Syntrophobacteraceae bacterium]|mgnify:CR=1 FL=1|nr:TIGR00153 family protein [Syntrophobacteraceae bacterium]
MILDKILSLGKKERRVTEEIRRHIELLCDACDKFRCALEIGDSDLMREVSELEREGDSVRRRVISHIYDGAFLPYIRPDLCRFVESVDEVFDALADTTIYYGEARVPEAIRGECIRVALLNHRMSDLLRLTYEAMLAGEDLREKTLAIRIFEKKIDDMKFTLRSEARKIPVENYWVGKGLSDFILGVTSISDLIEDASDQLEVLSVILR